ncbi:hypothetical protein RJ640_025754 [Escallonia rubra]|uniref:RING-type E3 ubiquitin transferase n=1 Tax=Escallonia rubra TaxID=112253 RepID=A0AA88UET1_9ASTE|nr:hypothetical protein RJ640_025754 [Escallonia rubra]
MGSVGNPNTWQPYNNYRDCSQGICSIYCPQWCYIIFPPPPPRPQEDDSGTNFSPLIIAVIGILASAFLLVSYYTIISKYCRRRSQNNAIAHFDLNHSEITHDQPQVGSTGLDEALIKSITVCKYKKGDGLVEGTDCAVCLSEFEENESLRLLPKCNHAFHLPCIDKWLRSHSNCPLCRSTVVLPSPDLQNSTSFNISALEVQTRNDLVLVVDNRARFHHEEVAISVVSDVVMPKNGEIGEEGGQQSYRRSMSLGSFSRQRNLLISDVLRIEEGDEDSQVGNLRIPSGIGSSKETWGGNSKSSDVTMKRSISTGGIPQTLKGAPVSNLKNIQGREA